jgi:hypothetical protein
MAIEAIQMLSTAHHLLGSRLDPSFIYKPAYQNHPCTVWTRATSGNYDWLCSYAEQLLIEYEFRFLKGHASWEPLYYLQTCLPTRIEKSDFFTPVIVTPGISSSEIREQNPFITNDALAIECYRKYYVQKMTMFGTFTKRKN